jgi:hypothetical protein
LPSGISEKIIAPLVPKMTGDDASPKHDQINWIVRPATTADAGRCEKLLKESYSTFFPQDYDHDTLSKALPIFTTPNEDLLACGS